MIVIDNLLNRIRYDKDKCQSDKIEQTHTDSTWHAPTTESKAFRHRVLTWNLALGHVRSCSLLLDSKHVVAAARPRCLCFVYPTTIIVFRLFTYRIYISVSNLYKCFWFNLFGYYRKLFYLILEFKFVKRFLFH